MLNSKLVVNTSENRSTDISETIVICINMFQVFVNWLIKMLNVCKQQKSLHGTKTPLQYDIPKHWE